MERTQFSLTTLRRLFYDAGCHFLLWMDTGVLQFGGWCSWTCRRFVAPASENVGLARLQPFTTLHVTPVLPLLHFLSLLVLLPPLLLFHLFSWCHQLASQIKRERLFALLVFCFGTAGSLVRRGHHQSLTAHCAHTYVTLRKQHASRVYRLQTRPQQHSDTLMA